MTFFSCRTTQSAEAAFGFERGRSTAASTRCPSLITVTEIGKSGQVLSSDNYPTRVQRLASITGRGVGPSSIFG